MQSHHSVIPATRYAHGDPNIWIAQMEREFRDKAIPPEHQLFVATFTLELPALTYYLEFAKICSSHTWLSFVNYLTTRVGKTLDTNLEATNQGDLVGTPSSSFQECSQEPSTGPLPKTYQERHQGSALAVVPCDSAFQPTASNTSTALIRGCEDERWATVQRLKEEHRKMMVEFIPSPQTQIEDTYSTHQQLCPANSHLGRPPQGTPLRATSLSEEVVVLSSSALLRASKIGIFEENKGVNLDLDSMLSKSPPTSTLSIHENSNWTICVFDPGGFNEPMKRSFAIVMQQQFLESSFFTNEEQYSTTIFIFDPGGCTISTILQQMDMIKFEMELQVVTIGEEAGYAKHPYLVDGVTVHTIQ